MDVTTFDRLARTFAIAGTRRAALGALLAGAGTALGLVRGQRAAAQGCSPGNGCCKDNGRGCHTGDDCCSGLCKRKNDGKKICKQADNQGECTIEENLCFRGSIDCGTGSLGSCFCFVTANGRSFCGATGGVQSCDCASNKACEQRLGKGAKCVAIDPNPADACTLCSVSGSACVAPCENLDPVP